MNVIRRAEIGIDEHGKLHILDEVNQEWKLLSTNVFHRTFTAEEIAAGWDISEGSSGYGFVELPEFKSHTYFDNVIEEECTLSNDGGEVHFEELGAFSSGASPSEIAGGYEAIGGQSQANDGTYVRVSVLNSPNPGSLLEGASLYVIFYSQDNNPPASGKITLAFHLY